MVLKNLPFQGDSAKAALWTGLWTGLYNNMDSILHGLTLAGLVMASYSTAQQAMQG